MSKPNQWGAHGGKGIFRVSTPKARMISQASPEKLERLANRCEKSVEDYGIELYLCICFAISLKQASVEYLKKGKGRAEKWVADTHLNHPDCDHRKEILEAAAMLLGQEKIDNAEAEKKFRDFEEADRLEEEALKLLEVYHRTLAESVLSQAILKMIKSAQLAAVRHPNFIFIVDNLTNMCDLFHQRTGDAVYLDFIIDFVSMSMHCLPKDSRDQPTMLNKLGKAYADRFAKAKNTKDVDEAIRLTQLAVDFEPRHPQWPMIVSNLGTWLGMRFKKSDNMQDIERAIQMAQKALDNVDSKHEGRPQILTNYGTLLVSRFERTEKMADLDKAIQFTELGVQTMDTQDPLRPLWLSNLASFITLRYDRHGGKKDLDQSIELLKKLKKEMLHVHYKQNVIANKNLGSLLWTRFRDFGSEDDLTQAIQFTEAAIRDMAKDDPERGGTFSNLANFVGTRYQDRGNREDLDRAIKFASKAVEATLHGDPDRPMYLNTLGSWLGRRFELVGAMGDLNHAIRVLEEAVGKLPTNFDNVRGATIMITLGTQLGNRFDREKAVKDIDRAIQLVEKALKIIPQSAPDRARWEGNLGSLYGRRYNHYFRDEDEAKAVEAAYNAVRTSSPGSMKRGWLINSFALRISQPGTIDAYGRAIVAIEMAIRDASSDHPELAEWLTNLGYFHEARYEQNQNNYDLEESRQAFKKGWECESARPFIRIQLARNVAEGLAMQEKWGESNDILHKAVDLLPIISPRSLENADKQHILKEISGLASLAAAVSLNAGSSEYEALSLLELGRGIIAGHLLDIRTDVSALRNQHGDLGKKFCSLRDELDAPKRSVSGDQVWESNVSRRELAEKEFKEIVTKIRTLPTFQHFLLPPSQNSLKKAAERGPIIVINVSLHRCDAFLVEKDQDVRAISLSITQEEVESQAKNLKSGLLTTTLEWLWKKVTSPILKALKLTSLPSDDDWQHVWWIPTGPLSNFPFHAAGLHHNGSTDTVLDRVISSYSSSIKAMLHGRRSLFEVPLAQKGKALLVAMKETPPGSSLIPRRLNFAEEEVKMLRGLCGSLDLEAVEPEEKERLKSFVLKNLPLCKVFHFAGHGLPDLNEPARGCLLLKDWNEDPLTVADFRDQNLNSQNSLPFLAYLSACLTGTNDATGLADEGVNLVGACQLAGFRHVIGSLWEVSDRHCVHVAEVLYQTIGNNNMTDDSVSKGLHLAIRSLRDKITHRTIVGREVKAFSKDLSGYEHNQTNEYNGKEALSSEGAPVGNGAESTRPRHVDEGGDNYYLEVDAPLLWGPYIHVGV